MRPSLKTARKELVQNAAACVGTGTFQYCHMISVLLILVPNSFQGISKLKVLHSLDLDIGWEGMDFFQVEFAQYAAK